MSGSESFAQLLVELRRGEPGAAATIFERYTRRLIGLARARLDKQLAARIDPDDVIQSVYGSFFRRIDQGEFELEGWNSLWALLAQITVFKCNRQVTFHRAEKRDLTRDQAPGDDSGVRFEPFGREPTPDEVIALTELVESLMRGLPEQFRQIVALRLAGHTTAEISEQIEQPLRSVERVIRLLKENLSAQLSAVQT